MPALTSGHPAVFMDRDGCLIEEMGYINHASRARVLPRTPEAIRTLNKAGIPAVMVTNQAGIARGYFSEEVLGAVHDELVRQLATHGAAGVLVLTGYGRGEFEHRREAWGVKPDHVAEDLLDAVEWALAR